MVSPKFIFPSETPEERARALAAAQSLATGGRVSVDQRTLNMVMNSERDAEARKVAEAKANVAAKKGATAAPTPTTGAIAGPEAEKEATTGGGRSIDAYANAFSGGTFGGTASSDPWVLRNEPRTIQDYPFGKPVVPTSPKSLDLYQAEYQKRIMDGDPAFRDWLARRASVFGVDLISDDGQFDIIKGESVWQQFGQWTAGNPELQKRYTPEQYADKLYNQYGGDAFYDKFTAEKAGAAKENPIHISTSTSYATMEPAAAEAAVDQLARTLLGRLASEKELNKYRKQINSFLKANPSTSRSVSNSETNTTKTVSKSGASAGDAVNILEQRLRRGSEGTAYTVGTAFEQALAGMDRGL